MNETTEQPYTRIAPLYDDIMRGVDYENWADYIDDIIQHHHIDTQTVLELGCGTGGHAFKLDELECYDILATDKSPEMIDCARRKSREFDNNVRFDVADFLNFHLDESFDSIFLVFDSINYVLNPELLSGLFQNVENHLEDEGIFIFDFTTPGFSMRIEETLTEPTPRTIGNLRYTRKSRWNPDSRIHTNHFFVDVLNQDTGAVIESFEEVHQQKIHSIEEIERGISASGLIVEARYSDFDFSEVNESTDRITMVLRKCRNSR